MCWKELTGIKRPTTYSCKVNDTYFKVIVTANITDEKFKLTMDDGNCYEGSLVYPEFEGTNEFKKINVNVKLTVHLLDGYIKNATAAN